MGWQVRRGVLIGAIIGAIAVAVAGWAPRGTGNERRPVISDCDGAIREIVIQYVPDAASIVTAPYRDFLGALPAHVTVHVVCPTRRDYEDLARLVGPVACRLSPVITDHAITTWSRDRWLALSAAAGDITLLAPRQEHAAEVWPQRAGDGLVARDIAAHIPGVRWERSPMIFDGGDFVADGETVFVTPRVAARNPSGPMGVAEFLKETLGRRIIMLDEAPDHHAGMFMMAAGRRTVVVGDPSSARRVAGDGALAGLCGEAGEDLSPSSQAAFDSVATRCSREGYRVIRMPVVPGRDGRTYITYTNVIIDEQSDRRIVYVPTYRGAGRLNEEAKTIWRSLGYEVVPIDCTTAYPHFGSLRCLVNVLRRGK